MRRILRHPLFAPAVFAGLLCGIALSLAPSSEASRSSLGVYTLPAGNPVVTGTQISSTWANATLSDIKTEITNSLDRGGRGAMTAPVHLADGWQLLPGLVFASEPAAGLYRAGSHDLRMTLNGQDAEKWTDVMVTLPIGVTVTNATANGVGAIITGNGVGNGATITGGNNTGRGMSVTGGAANGGGILVSGTGTGYGISAGGGATSGVGVSTTGGAPNGVGLITAGTGAGAGLTAVGGATGVGGAFSNLTAATGAVRKDALSMVNGDLDMSGVTNPLSDAGITDRLTPLNIPKAWARITNASGVPSIAAGFNIASISCSALAIHVTMATAMTNTSYFVSVTRNSTDYDNRLARVVPSSSTVFDLTEWTAGGTDVDVCDGTDGNGSFSVLVFGAQ